MFLCDFCGNNFDVHSKLCWSFSGLYQIVPLFYYNNSISSDAKLDNVSEQVYVSYSLRSVKLIFGTPGIQNQTYYLQSTHD